MIDGHNNIQSNELSTSTLSKNQILINMLQAQRKDLSFKIKLDMDDINRIIYNINTSPLSDTECCIWTGYITSNEKSKTKYINFYFKHHKIALHRLLYINYIGDLDNNSYLKFTCKNKGICCNVKHIEKSNNKQVANEILIKNNDVQTIKENSGEKKDISTNNFIQVIKLSSTNNDEKKSRKFIVVFD